MPSGIVSATDGDPMTYRQATDYVERLAILGMRFGLERMERLLSALGSPHRSAPAIHVVGTNGKSSTCRLASAALASQGILTGTYLSPHVTGWRERIEVDGHPIPEQAFAAAIQAVRDAVALLDLGEDDSVTQFEVLTAAGFVAFAAAGVQAMVIEAGLGGRFDATNVLADDAVVVLTNVALEHTELLGSTEAQIAAEKLAVAPTGSDRVIVGRLSEKARIAVQTQFAARDLAGWRFGAEVLVRGGGDHVDVVTPTTTYTALPLPLRGAFQLDNLAVGVAAAERRLGRALSVEPLREAVRAVTMPGRLEVMDADGFVVLDGAHNPAGVEAMVTSLPQVVEGRKVVAVVSILGDKDVSAMIAPLAAVIDTVVATRSSHPRAAAPEVIAHLATLAGMRSEAVEEPIDAIHRARVLAGPDGAVLVCGSLYLLADVRVRFLRPR